MTAEPVGALACDDMCSCALEGRVSVLEGQFLSIACSFAALVGTVRCHWSCPLLAFGLSWMRPRFVFTWADRQAPAPALFTSTSTTANALKTLHLRLPCVHAMLFACSVWVEDTQQHFARCWFSLTGFHMSGLLYSNIAPFSSEMHRGSEEAPKSRKLAA